ncbi:MAG: ATP-binding protein [candidate division Zixibacteria bacterium]|nr:ATP-binding protein [candidate division Zixibacteria bacterium]
MRKPTIINNSIRIPSSEEHLPDVDSFLEGILRGYGVEETIIADIAISVTELVINGIIHGNGSNPDKDVTVAISKKDANVEVVVQDQGDGFNPDEIENPIDAKNLLKEVGRGIFIVKSLMDSVAIDRTTRGTRITITKKVS